LGFNNFQIADGGPLFHASGREELPNFTGQGAGSNRAALYVRGIGREAGAISPVYGQRHREYTARKGKG